jgi:hypothetical protein
VAVPARRRALNQLAGLLLMVGAVAAVLAFNVYVSLSLKAMPKVAGSFTFSDQRCLDAAFLSEGGVSAPSPEGGEPLWRRAAAGLSVDEYCGVSPGASLPRFTADRPHEGATGAEGYVAQMGALVGATLCTSTFVEPYFELPFGAAYAEVAIA